MVPAGVAAPGIAVLLVDDEPSLLELGRRFLERAGGIRVTTAPSAPAAMTLLSSGTYDAIVSDYQMPQVNGIDFLRQVRAAGDSTPFIIFTGKGREEVAIEALNSGADFYLQKGGDPRTQFAELLHVIRQVVSSRRSERALSEMQQRTAEILEFLPDATFAIDANSTVIAWNHAMEVMTGVKKDAILGEGNYAYAVPFYGKRRPILIDLIFGGEEIVAGKYPYVRKEGDRVFSEIFIPHLNSGSGAYLWFTASPLYDSAGNIAGAIESIRDITDRKQAELALLESESRYRLLAEKMNDIIFTLDLSLRTTYVSPSVEKVLGFSPEERMEQDLADQVTPASVAVIREAFARELALEQESGADPDRSIILGIEFYHRDGSTRWCEVIVSGIRNNQGVLAGFHGVARDITARKAAEEALRESEERFRVLFEQSPVPYHSLDAAGRFIAVNNTWLETLGYSRDEVIGHWFGEFVVPEQRKLFIERFPLFMQAGSLLDAEYLMQCRDGRTILASFNGRIGYNPDGSFRQTHCIFQDITRTAQAQEALEKSEAEKALILGSITDMVAFYASPDLRITWANKASGDSVSCVSGAMSEHHCYTIWHQRDAPCEPCPVLRAFATGEPQQMEVTSPDGRVWLLRAFPARDDQGAVTGVVEVGREITGLKKVEEALREKSEMFKLIAENTGDYIYIFDMDLTIRYISPAVRKVRGFSSEEVMAQSLDEMLTPASLERSLVFFQEELAREGDPGADPDRTRIFETEEYCKDKTTVFIENTVTFLRDAGGKSTGILGVARDITGRKAAEEALRESREQYYDLAAHAPVGILTCDREGQITYVNQRVLEMLGSPGADETRAINLLQFPPLQEAGFTAVLRQTMETGETARAVEMEYTSHWGRRAWYRGHLSPIIEDGLVTGARIILDDISERKRAEEARINITRKLHLLSTITRHDTNNQLMVITGFLDLLQNEVADPALGEYFSRITNASEKIAAILRFSKVYESVGMHTPVWQDVSTLVEHAAGEITLDAVRMVNEIPPGLEVSADPLIEKVFANLVDNAVRYGETITTIRFSGREQDSTYVMVCEDDGVGIPADDKEKIFDHGFGKNTGLGLFLAREILAITGISIRETGEQGKGARFEMVVPPGRYRVKGSEHAPDPGSPPP